MLDNLNLVFGNENQENKRKRLFALAMQLEQLTSNSVMLLKGDTIDHAKALRDIVAAQTVGLEQTDKTRIFDIVNRVKVKALRTHSLNGYKVFRALDSISGQLRSSLELY